MYYNPVDYNYSPHDRQYSHHELGRFPHPNPFSDPNHYSPHQRFVQPRNSYPNIARAPVSSKSSLHFSEHLRHRSEPLLTNSHPYEGWEPGMSSEPHSEKIAQPEGVVSHEGQQPYDGELSQEEKMWLMLHYIPSEHSCCSLLYRREVGDPYTHEQRKWLFIWVILLVMFQTIVAFWLFHNYEATLDMMKQCHSACQAANPQMCGTHAIEVEDDFGENWSQTSFTLITFGDERYFSFYRPMGTPLLLNFTECATFRLCAGGSCMNTVCTTGCVEDRTDYYADDCELGDKEAFGLLCRHPDVLPRWKKYLWFWVIIPIVFYIALFPLRNLLLYMCMPLLNHRHCASLCKCFLYPQYAIFFTAFLIITISAFSICIHTYQELYHSSFFKAMLAVVFTCVMSMLSAIIFEVPALMMDFWCCKRWKEIEIPEDMWWYHASHDYIPMEPGEYDYNKKVGEYYE